MADLNCDSVDDMFRLLKHQRKRVFRGESREAIAFVPSIRMLGQIQV